MSMAFLAFSSLPAFALFGTSVISFFLPLATLIMSDCSTLLLPKSGARQTVLKEREITYRSQSTGKDKLDTKICVLPTFL